MKQYKTTTNSNRYEKFELFKRLGLTCLNSNINIHQWIVQFIYELRSDLITRKKKGGGANKDFEYDCASIGILFVSVSRFYSECCYVQTVVMITLFGRTFKLAIASDKFCWVQSRFYLFGGH